MLKTALVLFMLVACGKICTQTCLNCTALFSYRFLNVPRQTDTLPVWHYKPELLYKPQPTPKKTEDYNYVHNGDPLKGAEDVFNSSVQGGAWFKDFDFGEFATIVIDIGPDKYGRPNGMFEWGGKLLFFNVLKNKKLAEVAYKGN